MPEAEKKKNIKTILMGNLVLLLFILDILLFVVGEMISAGFMSFEHVTAVLRTASFLGIVAIGQTLAILTAGIDLSVGAMITMGNVFACMMINGVDANTIWALAAIIAIGAAFGAFSGFGVAYLRISPLVMTLAVGSLVTGVTLVVSHGAPKGLASPALRFIGVGNVLGLPMIVLVWALLTALVVTLLRAGAFGRKVYYVGANPKAAYLSGVKVNPVLVAVYAISGASASLTGALMSGYTQTGFLGIGEEYIMWSITAVVIGGTALTGGKGSYLGSVAGAVLLVLIESLLTVVQIPEAGRKIANGLIILIMIAIYYRKKSGK